jgi:hypothetical protein
MDPPLPSHAPEEVLAGVVTLKLLGLSQLRITFAVWRFSLATHKS